MKAKSRTRLSDGTELKVSEKERFKLIFEGGTGIQVAKKKKKEEEVNAA